MRGLMAPLNNNNIQKQQERVQWERSPHPLKQGKQQRRRQQAATAAQACGPPESTSQPLAHTLFMHKLLVKLQDGGWRAGTALYRSPTSTCSCLRNLPRPCTYATLPSPGQPAERTRVQQPRPSADLPAHPTDWSLTGH